MRFLQPLPRRRYISIIWVHQAMLSFIQLSHVFFWCPWHILKIPSIFHHIYITSLKGFFKQTTNHKSWKNVNHPRSPTNSLLSLREWKSPIWQQNVLFVCQTDGFKISKSREFPWNLVHCEILKVTVAIQNQAPNRCPQCVVYCQPAWRWVVWWPSWSHATRWSLA